MALFHYGQSSGHTQDSPYPGELPAVLDSLDDGALLARLQEYRWTGRRGYALRALWRAYVASFVLNLPHTNALIRRLEDDADLRALCGFDDLPHRTTFNRFIHRLSLQAELVEQCFFRITNELKALLPDLGREVAVDSTAVRSHSNPHRTVISDPEASWTAKNSTRAKGGKEWTFGYKVHMVADINYGLPLAQVVKTAKHNDSPELPGVMEHAYGLYPWFCPTVAAADRGYDAKSNHEYLDGKGVAAIIPVRQWRHGGEEAGLYTQRGTPICVGGVPMRHVRTDPEKGHLFACVGCHLLGSRKGGVAYCDSEVWEKPGANLRLVGKIMRGTDEWEAIYTKRQAIERVFKGMKQSRRLEAHCVRGLRQLTLHAAMSTLTYQATALARLRAGERDKLTWMVRKVA